jgi:hypothetical protein
MRKFLISAALLSATVVATPASAQYYGHRGEDRIDHQLNQIEQRIRIAADRGTISRGEARGLLRQAHQLDRLEDRYSRNGLSRWERDDLRNRLQHLRQQLRFERQEARWDDRRDRWDD